VLNHRAAEIALRDDAIRFKIVIGLYDNAAPAVRAELAGPIREDVAKPVNTKLP
jgi:hypothetical protein